MQVIDADRDQLILCKSQVALPVQLPRLSMELTGFEGEHGSRVLPLVIGQAETDFVFDQAIPG